MAELALDGQEIKCPICMEDYIQPRRLTTCSHTFCENCIFSFVSKAKERTGYNFECPLCRSSQSLPENEDITIDLIRRLFPLNREIDTKIVEKSSFSVDDNTEVCDPCKYVDESNPAVKYCTDCLEGLCVKCIDFHKRLRSLRHHKLISFKEEGLESKILKKWHELMMCPKHSDRQVEFYCCDEEILCCPKCATDDHRTCKQIVDIKNAENQLTFGHNINDMISAYSSIEAHLSNVKTAKAENIEKLNKQLDLITKPVDDLRTQINSIFDQIETKLNQQAKSIKTSLKAKEITSSIDSSPKLDEMKESVKLLECIQQHGSSSNSFAVLHSLDRNIKDLETFIHDELPSQKQEQLKVTIDAVLLNISKAKDIESSVSLSPCATDAVLNEYVYKTMHLRNIHKINDADIPNAGGSDPTYSDVTWLQDGGIIILDSYKRYCSITDSSFHITNEKKIGAALSSVFVHGLSIYISVPSKKEILLQNAENLDIIAAIPTERPAQALYVLNNGTIAVAWKDPVSFSFIEINGTRVTETNFMTGDTKGRSFQSFEYLAINETRAHVIQPCSQSKAVYGFTFDGTPVFKFSENIEMPKGVDVDRYGNIYICDSDKPQIIQLSPLGIVLKRIKNDIPKEPVAISVNKDSNKLAVTNNTSPWATVYIFELK